MDSPSNRRRMNVEDDDRLSILPQDVIAKILSNNGMKQAVETSVLSSRWKYIWTTVPYLRFSSADFNNKTQKFYRFLTRVFSSCNDQVEFSLNLCGKLSQVFVNKILNAALSRNIQELTLSILHENRIELDLSFFSSQSLKHLSLHGSDRDHCIMPTSIWVLPALISLYLEYFTLYDDDGDDDDTNKCVDLLSKCANLKNLTLDNCRIIGSGSITICHPHISNLTLKYMSCRVNVVKVVTPQLHNLTIETWDGEHIISAPHLTSLIYKNCPLLFSVDIDSLPSLENVVLCVDYPSNEDDARKVVNLLQKFSHVRFLTLSTEIIEVISSSVELVSHLPSPFHNLKTLRISPELLHDTLNDDVTLPIEVKNYFLGSSPSANFTMVSRKELRVVRDAELAQSLMEELRVEILQVRLQMRRPRVIVRLEPKKNPELDMSERVRIIENCWEDMIEQIDIWKRMTIPIIKLIQQIKDLLITLPASKKAEMQPELSRLCAEADTVMDKIVNLMKTVWNNQGSRIGVCLHELTTAAQSSS